VLVGELVEGVGDLVVRFVYGEDELGSSLAVVADSCGASPSTALIVRSGYTPLLPRRRR
jgi:hypothetical protein